MIRPWFIDLLKVLSLTCHNNLFLKYESIEHWVIAQTRTELQLGCGIWQPEVHLLRLESLLPHTPYLPVPAPTPLLSAPRVSCHQIDWHREERTACEKLWTWRTDHKLHPKGQCCVWKDFLVSAERNSNSGMLTQLTCIHWDGGGVNFFFHKGKCI